MIDIEKEIGGSLRSLIGKAYEFKLKGSWHGSAHGYHPRGVIRNGIKLIDHWNVNNYRDIVIAENPACEWRAPEDASCAMNAAANPKPKDCKEIVVWSSGEWRQGWENGPWIGLIVSLLRDLKAEIAEAQILKDAADTEQKLNAEREKREADERVTSAWKKAAAR